MMQKYRIANQAMMEHDELVNRYAATQMIFPDILTDYMEQIYRSISLFNKGPRLSVYESTRHGKYSRVYTIRQNYAGWYDVAIIDAIKVAGAEHETYVYTNSFPTLKEAVKAKYRHYKD